MAATTADDSFAPVLNVPAFCAFALIAVVFGILQYRVMQIQIAVDDRQVALEELRKVKAAQLGGSSEGFDDIVEKATATYTEAYWRVERLRTVVPGIMRIRAPVENALNTRGAQQFLGIDPPVPEDEDEVEEGSLAAKISAAVLGFIALSQIGLLLLFATDPLHAINTLEGSL